METDSALIPKALPPIMRIPPEMSAKIFHFCLPERFTLQYPAPQLTEAPFLLCKVCTRWRELALSIPQLWSTICVHAFLNLMTPNFPLLRLWLERSGNAPLSLSLIGIDPVGVESILKLFGAQFHRWQRVRFELPIPSFPDALLGRHQARASLLKEAHLQAIFQTTDDFRLDPTQSCTVSHFLNSSPFFQILSWGAPCAALFSADVPWIQLTEISIAGRIFIDEAYRILRLSRNLVSLKLSNIAHSQGPQPQLGSASKPVPLLCPALRSIELRTVMELSRLFEQLLVPGLRRLKVDHVRITACKFQPLTSLLVNSGCDLEELEVNLISTITENDFITLLQNTPALRTLVVTNNHISSLLIDRFADENSPPLCPRLETLRLLGKHFTSPDGQLASMIASRSGMLSSKHSSTTVACLKHVTINFAAPSEHTQDVAQLEAMRDEGLEVVLLKGPSRR